MIEIDLIQFTYFFLSHPYLETTEQNLMRFLNSEGDKNWNHILEFKNVTNPQLKFSA